MIGNFLYYIGDGFLSFLRLYKESLSFAIVCLFKMFSRQSYTSASKRVLIRQIYFTSVQIAPLFCFIAAIFGIAFISSVSSYFINLGLEDNVGDIVVTVLLNEIAPLSTVFLVALRSSSAIAVEIASMKDNHELNTLKAFGIDIISYLYLPRIIGGMISVLLLTALFVMFSLDAGYLFLALYYKLSLSLFVDNLVKVIELGDMIVLVVKSLLFGFFITLIPIYTAIQAPKGRTATVIAVSNAMVKIFVSIFVVEVLSLLVKYM